MTEQDTINESDFNAINGDIRFENFTQTYGQTEAISNINLSIKAGEKILICGRSGCGKSTLVNSIFRISNPKSYHGAIFIDDKNMENYDINHLRSQLMIIPQVFLIYIYLKLKSS